MSLADCPEPHGYWHAEKAHSMTDDEIAASLELAAARLRKRPPQAGWIGQFRRGEVLTTAHAADVADVDPETVRRWCEADDDAEHPLGFLIEASQRWLVDLL